MSSCGRDGFEGGEGGELELEPRIHGRAADVVEAVAEVLVVVDDVVVPVARGQGLHGGPVPGGRGGPAQADPLGRPHLDGVRVDQPRGVRGRDREREPHVVLLFEARHRRLRPHPRRLVRGGGGRGRGRVRGHDWWRGWRGRAGWAALARAVVVGGRGRRGGAGAGAGAAGAGEVELAEQVLHA